MSDARAPLTLNVAAATDVSSRRFHNEDWLGFGEIGGALRIPWDYEGNAPPRSRRDEPPHAFVRERLTSERGFVLGVYDGCGGYATGETASRLAAKVVHASMGAAPLPRACDELRGRLGRAVEDANREVFVGARDDPRRRGMGTTATVAAIVDDRLCLASVGDSRAYLLRGRRLTQVTEDDTLVRAMLREGRLLPEEVASFPHRNVITRALGMSDALPVAASAVRLRDGDTLLLCTDGLSGEVADPLLRAALLRQHDVGVACRALVDEALSAGGHDNVTVIVSRFEAAWLDPPGPGDEVAIA